MPTAAPANPHIATIDRWLSDFLDRHAPAGVLRDATRYAVLGTGKRIRPTLVIESCLACGGSIEATLPAAGAIEMVHAFSLVHDDLPAMDDDDLRRGLPTTHAKFGEAMGILAGDALMTFAFAALADVRPTDRAAALARILTQATSDMIAGQVLDTIDDHGGGDDTFQSRTPLQRVQEIHAKKTGALLRAACLMGGVCAGLTEPHPQLTALTQYADAIGLMFQIVDDLLDVEQSHEHTGKRTGKDAKAGKLTYPGILGVDAARAEVGRLEREALDALAPFGAPGAKLGEMARSLARRTH
ncbi:MAG: polyprenyl synthetase family protein [Phycisphaerales bacterium]|nr:polyprenyl synthetase family protein [Phycisphaerales bacterium]